MPVDNLVGSQTQRLEDLVFQSMIVGGTGTV